MSTRPLLAACTTGLLLTAAALAGCGSHGRAAAPMTPAAATNTQPIARSHPHRAPAEQSEDDDDDGSDGILVVSKDIVAACAQLQAVKRAADRIDPDSIWLVVLEGLADCMTDGDLRAQRVRVTGDDEGREIVRRVLIARGVSPQRLAFVNRVTGNGRVDITLVPGKDEGNETTL